MKNISKFIGVVAEWIGVISLALFIVVSILYFMRNV